MNKTALQEQAQTLISSIKGEGAESMPDLSGILKGGMMGLMSNPTALVEAAQGLGGKFDGLMQLAENFNERLVALEAFADESTK